MQRFEVLRGKASRYEMRIGKYQVVRKIGEGDLTQVYCAYKCDEAHVVALNVLKMCKEDVPERARALLLQRKLLMDHIKHPSIATYSDYGEQDGLQYVITDYAPGGSLRQIHSSGSRLELPVIIDYVQQVAAVLQIVHDQRFIHACLKPENMLQLDQQHLLLSDFGPAHNIYLDHPLNVEYARFSHSAFYYVAPEQLIGRVQPASDQYALAAIVYEWITGKPPFTGSIQHILHQHITAVPPSLDTFVPAVSSAIERVIMKALSKDSRQRFDSILTFAHALA